MFEGRTVEQKRELVQVLTREAARILTCGPADVHILIEDVRKENWGAGGRLCSET